MTINARFTSKISASLATMPDYATMVRAGVRDRQVSGTVFLTAFADRHRHSTTEIGFRSYFSPYVIRPLRLPCSARQSHRRRPTPERPGPGARRLDREGAGMGHLPLRRAD